jgi:hypothetical protein
MPTATLPTATLPTATLPTATMPRQYPFIGSISLAIILIAASASAQEKHTLQYRFHEDDVVVTRISHLAETETTINGNTQNSSSRTVSLRVWKVTGVDDSGTATIRQSLRSVDMAQKLPERPEETYNSNKDQEAPPDFEPVAKTIGKDLSVIKINVHGEVIDRTDIIPNTVLPGLGQVAMPLPDKPVALESKWYFPTDVHIRLGNGKFKKVKTRQEYSLKAVKNGVATIQLKTQVLTPINDRRIEVQLVQQITNGTIKFDMVAGHMISKKVNWNETVVGYRGGNSRFKIVAQHNETRLTAEEVAKHNEALSR